MADIKLSDAEQLARMRDAHYQHSRAAHALGDHLSQTLGGLLSCTNWEGTGFDDATTFFHHFIAHAHQFGNLKGQLGDHIGTYYERYKQAEQDLTPE